ncbi:MAG: S-ribosylhomocysteine lyase [Faecalibacterium sp.]
MKKIASFSVDHTNLLPGLYVSRQDQKNDTVVTTFDLRFTQPNQEPAMDSSAMHTIEHIGATYLRNSAHSENIVYFGPMGCKTGFYLVMFGDLSSADVLRIVQDMCQFILSFTGEIPGAKPAECGNYSLQNLDMAKYYAKKYLHDLEAHQAFFYQ